jgi:hypothetical protein
MASFETRWEAPEFEYHPKGVSWYWLSIIIAAAVTAFAIWDRNFLFGVFVVIAEILLIAWGNETPTTVNFTLTENDLSIGNAKNYQLNLFENFSANERGSDWTEIFFTFKTKLRTPLKILAPKTKIDEIRKGLKSLLREVEFEPSLLDSLEKIIGF